MVMTDVGNSDQVTQSLPELAWLQAGLSELVAQTSRSIHTKQGVLKSQNSD